MEQVLRIDGDRIRDLTEYQRASFLLEAPKVTAITMLVVLSALTLAPVLTLLDELNGHKFLSYKNEIKDVPAFVHISAILFFMFISYKIIPQCFYTIKSLDPSIFIKDGGIYVGGTRIEIENLNVIDYEISFNKLYVTTISGERKRIAFRGLCRGMADLFREFGALEVTK